MVHPSGKDWRPRCDSCRAPIEDLVFQITFERDADDNETVFMVGAECAPIPGDHKYTVKVWNLRKEYARYDETRN